MSVVAKGMSDAILAARHGAPGTSMCFGDVKSVGATGGALSATVESDGGTYNNAPVLESASGVRVGDRVMMIRSGGIIVVVGIVRSAVDPHALKVLWSDDGGWWPRASQTITLSEPVSAQRTGIVLRWQYYSDSTARQYNYNYTFIPKTHVADAAGVGVNCVIATSSNIASKYVYVSDEQIKGNDYNMAEQTGNGGLVMVNDRFVLTKVLGV